MPNLQCLGIVSAVSAVFTKVRVLSGRGVGVDYCRIEICLYV